jgi:uncharacterized membrane-anchored protein
MLLFALAVAVQVVLLGALAGSGLAIRTWGTPITLRVAPYDPYSIMRGYYASLQYDINRPPADMWGEQHNYGTDVYAELAPGKESVWELVALHRAWPKEVPPSHVLLRGKEYGERIEYGIEQYFVPETERGVIETALREHPDGVATIRIGPFGIAQVESINVGGREFRY